ncbi:MAG: LysR family transcriptional regulator [Actinomycetia bacterium]|nr:LysR family transcriptional regulator [Actinomycetes bacterium]MCP4958566.1 LysR family transcriptional regulator [Actinomycetes bacterium]
MKLDIESLRALQAVAETGTFTAAAARLGMTQSAVSWKIKRLEERVGLDLVKRGQEIEPTPDGSDLLSYADKLITIHDEAVERLGRSDLEGVVRLGSNEDLRGGDLADVLARFGRMYPQIRLDVRVQLSGTVCEWLDDGTVDLAVVQIPSTDVRPDDIVLWSDRLRWVKGVGHSFDPGEIVPVVSFGPGLAYLDHATEALARAGIRSRTILECPMLSGVQAAVEAGLGVAAVHSGNITEAMTEWEHGSAFELPELCEVIRSSHHGDPGILDALKNMLSNALVGERS